MTTPVDDIDDMTEVFDARFSRVDAVTDPANGTPFLISKAEGLMRPELIRDLIKEADATPAPRDDITMTASPAALMKMIHEAAQKPPVTAAPEEPAVAVIAKADVVPDASDVIANGGGTAESLPGSPDWETMDADTAQTAIGLLGRVKAVLEWLGDREATESVTSDPDDIENVFDLQDAECAVDCALDTLAGYAVGEQLEAEMVDDVSMIGKAMATLDPTALAKLEGFRPITKAGRVLSAANETAIRGAVESLTNVLNTLPAPIPDAAPVAKESEVTEDPDTDTDTEPISDQEDEEAAVAKAKGDPLTPVYDENGKLVGMVDATDLIPIATAPAASDADAPATTDDGAPVDATDGPAADAPVAPPAPPMTPAAPVADVQKSEEAPAAESDPTEMLKAALAAQEERIAKLEAQPMPGGPMLNGAFPGADPIALRGDGTSPTEDLRKAYESETNPTRRTELQMALAAQLVQHAPKI